MTTLISHTTADV